MIKLYNDDCYNILNALDNNSIDLILIDPPYIISRQTNFSKGGGDSKKYGSISMDFGEWDKNRIRVRLAI